MATAAARDAQRRRDHTIRNLVGNPYVLPGQIEALRNAFEDWAASALGQSWSADEALGFAELSVYAGIMGRSVQVSPTTAGRLPAPPKV